MNKGDAWTDFELASTAQEYAGMRRDMLAGRRVIKAHVYRRLNDQFANGGEGRGVSAYERRMMNISHVYSLLGLSHVPGLLPAANMGRAFITLNAIVCDMEMRPVAPALAASTLAEPGTVTHLVTRHKRDSSVVNWTRENAKGTCEVCLEPAPFLKGDGVPYLEVHHLRPLASGGPDTVDNTVACCPNCHRSLHYGANQDATRDELHARIDRLSRY